jgi:predicted Zn-dependent peptidase
MHFKSLSIYFLGCLLFIGLFWIEPSTAQDGLNDAALDRLVNKVVSRTLSNGLRVIFYHRGIAPVFTGAVSVRVGGVNEQKGSTGIAHMFEHMAFKGTQVLGTKDYQKEKPLLDRVEVLEEKVRGGHALTKDEQQELIKINAELDKIWVRRDFDKTYQEHGGTNLNAHTMSELTQFYVSLPSTAFDFWCWMESERLLHPVLRQFYSERDVVMEERRMRFEDSPEGKLYEKLLQTVFTVHPYRNPVIGYTDDIKRLTATMVITIVGDIDPPKAIPILEKYFGQLPVGPMPEQPTIVEPAQKEERHVVVAHDSSPQIVVAYHKPQYPNPQDPKIGIMSEILDGGKTSVLYKELVQKRRLVSSIESEEGPGSAFPNALMFVAHPIAPHTNLEVLSAFDELISEFKSKLVSDDDLAKAKRSMMMDYISHLKSDNSLALNLASSELLYNDWQAYIKWNRMMLAVTKEDVQDVARKYLTVENRTIGTIERKKLKKN